MTKKPKLPRTHKALEELLAEECRKGYNSAHLDARVQVAQEVEQRTAKLAGHVKYLEQQNSIQRREAIQALSRMGQAVAEVAMALSKVVEPRQI